MWVPTIENGTNQYTMTLGQPEGVPFMVTVWGKSGIQFAGTTDIYSTSIRVCNQPSQMKARGIEGEKGHHERDGVED